MTDDQVTRLISLGRDVAHIVDALEAMRETISRLATKEELAAMVTRSDHDKLGYRVETVERTIMLMQQTVREQSALSFIDRLTKIAVAITAVAAAFGVVGAITLFFMKP